jgi:PhoPQ-activated pathogenicity-related protein
MKFRLVGAARHKATSTARRRGGSRFRGLRIEALEERRMLDASTPWQNPVDSLDVNNDGFETPIDALLIINRLNTVGPGDVPALTDATPPPYYDTTGNNVITGLDALLVISALNDHVGAPTLEAHVANLVRVDGRASVDGTTADATVAGKLTTTTTVKSFTVQVDNGPVTDIKSKLQPDGSFTLTPAFLTSISTGATLIDGNRTVLLRTSDPYGHISTIPLALALRRLDLATAPLSDDITPQVIVQVAPSLGLANGTPVKIDVDMNNDGLYTPTELNYATGTLFNNAATFELAPGLLTSQVVGGAYNINVRARVQNVSGTQQAIDSQEVRIDTTTSDVLKDYVNFNDGKFQWNVVSTIPGVGYTVYIVNMISQQWLTPGDTNLSLWRHWVTVVVPSGPVPSKALLFIDGGNSDDDAPTVSDPVVAALIQGALLTHSVMIELQDVPNQAQIFTGETPVNARTEDQVLAYTFDHFLNDPSQTDWPALLPMTKAAVKAMDMVQAFVPTVAANQQQIDSFVVSGGSKRGWTTWLTAAVDNRVIAIAPIVFDALNLDEQMVHHYGAYDFFSPAIKPYEDLQVFDRILTNQGQQLGQIVDPYRYIYDGRFNIPKLLLDSTGDQFFLPDSAQFYIHDLPGKTSLQYVPNSSHGLGDDVGVSNAAFNSLVTFYASILTGIPTPQYSWSVQPDGSISATTATAPTQVLLWQATNPDARDFRKQYTNVTYTSTVLSNHGAGVYTANVPTPASGATAFFIEFTFPSLLDDMPYRFTTEIHVKTSQPLFDWPFPIGDGVFDLQLPLVAGGAPPAAGALLMSTHVGAASQISEAAFALALPAQVVAPSSALLGTQGIAAVVTTLQAASDETATIVETTDEIGLNDPLLLAATAGAGVVGNNNAADSFLGSQPVANDLVPRLLVLSQGYKFTLG